MKMKDRSRSRVSPQQWRITRFFRRDRKGKNSSFSEITGGSRDVTEEATEPTDVSITSPSTGNVDFESAKLSEGQGSRVGEEGREEHSELFDHVSIAENSSSHLEVRLVERREGTASKGNNDAGPIGSFHRASVMESIVGNYSHDNEAGMEIILAPNFRNVLTEEENVGVRCSFTTPNGKQDNQEGKTDSVDNSKPLEELVESQNDVRGTGVDGISPRVCITTVTLPSESPFAKPSVCQEASDHSPASDSLTWISHDCELVDDRPMKEISFRTLSHIAETTDSESLDRNESSSLVSSLPKCLRDEIFATFDSESPAPLKSEVSSSHDAASPASDAHQPLTLQWPEPYSRTPSRVDQLLDSLELKQTEDVVLRSVGSIDREREDAQASDGSTISSHGNNDELRLPLSSSSKEQAIQENHLGRGQLMQLVRRARSGDLQLESAFASVNALKCKSFDSAANLKSFALQTLNVCGETQLPSCQRGAPPRHNLSLVDTLTDDDNDSSPTSTATSAPGSPREASLPASSEPSNLVLDLRAPKLLIREISTDDESSVMSESLTSDSCTGSSLDADDEEDDDDEDDESSISTRPGKDAPPRNKVVSSRLKARVDHDYDDEDSGSDYDEFITGCL